MAYSWAMSAPSPYPVMKLCIECDHELPEREETCPACGAGQPHMPTVYTVWVMAALFLLGSLKACFLG